ncbi:SufS family cysteine desulfurase [Candidatus Dependentiae bacterium]|nr:SufS family cysteine desulfurase [Candidatus Dependentiae bacterium]
MISRSDFPLFKRPYFGRSLIYFDNASTTQKPQAVIDALIDFYSYRNANIHRGIYTLAEKATAQYEQVRKKVATYIGARDAVEIVFTSGTTAGINMAATSWVKGHLSAGDEILITQMEHHANLLPWQQLARTHNVTLKYIPVLADGTLEYVALDTLITSRTKFVSLVHVSHILGTHNDVELIIKRAHAVGARVMVDAAQSVPHQRINVTNMDCDFLTFSGHKMFGPTGVGVLYIKKELHDQIEPYQFGGGMVFDADYDRARWQPLPHRLEAGTPPIAQVIGLGAAIDYLCELNAEELQRHEASLCAQLIEGLDTLPRIRVLGPVKQLKKTGHLVSFVVDGMHAHDIAAYLDSFGICVRAGHHCAQPLAKKMNIDASVRVSFYAYNTHAEVDVLLDALRAL